MIFLVGICLGLSQVIVAKNSNSRSQSKQVDKIINNYYRSIGGYEKLKKIRTLIRKGTYIEPAYNLILPTAKTESKRPNFRLVGNPAEGFAEGFDGASWEYFKEKGVIRSKGEAEAATRRGAEFDESFVDFREKGHQVTLEGITNLGINKVYDLKVVLNDGWIKHYYLDVKTNLVIGLKKAMPVHAKGKAVETITFISGYKPVNGVLFPFEFIERKTSDGSLLNALLLNSIEANVEIENSRFSPPQLQK